MPIPQHIRDAVLQRDRFECHYCADKLTTKNATIDHKRPLSTGGKHRLDNLVTACCRCNNIKADIPFEAFVAIKAELADIWHEKTVFRRVLETFKQQQQRGLGTSEWDAVLAGCWR